MACARPPWILWKQLIKTRKYGSFVLFTQKQTENFGNYHRVKNLPISGILWYEILVFPDGRKRFRLYKLHRVPFSPRPKRSHSICQACFTQNAGLHTGRRA